MNPGSNRSKSQTVRAFKDAKCTIPSRKRAGIVWIKSGCESVAVFIKGGMIVPLDPCNRVFRPGNARLMTA